MKIDFSWKENRKSLIGALTVLSILILVRLFKLGIIDGTILGAIVGVSVYFILDRILPKSKDLKK